MFSIKNDLLFIDGAQVEHKTTSNKSRGEIDPTGLTIHYTATDSMKASVEALTFKRKDASAHLVLGLDAELVQIETFRTKLWHAGKSWWRGRPNCNDFMIGIEVVRVGWLNVKGDDGRWRREETWKGKTSKTRWYDPAEDDLAIGRHPNGGRLMAWPKFTPAQMSVLNELVPALRDHYGLEVVFHDQIAPARKVDPGLCIDRECLARWNGAELTEAPAAEPLKRKTLRLGSRDDDVIAVQLRLAALTYPVGQADGVFGRMTCEAVQRFQQSQDLEPDGVVGPNTWGALFPA